jgi:hypothetical protein
MPNWCANGLTLKHEDSAMIDKAVAALAKGELLETFIPIGEWDYNKALEAWGTKWDVGGEGVSIERIDENTVTMSFDSAWAPPTHAYVAFESLGFDVDAYYYEPGMCFCGHYADGYDDYYEYSDMNSEEVATNIPSEIDEYFCISESMAQWEEENEEDEE